MPIHLELRALVPTTALVFGSRQPPDTFFEEAAALLEPPLAGVIADLLERDALSVEVGPRSESPAFMRHGVGEEEERRFARATVVAQVDAIAPFGAPPLAHLAVGATARALATAMCGVIFDPYVPRLRKLVDASTPTSSRPRIKDEIVCLLSRGPRGVWASTRGMTRFGLPNLELRDLPGEAEPHVSAVLNGIAACVLREAHARAAPWDEETPQVIPLPDELVVTAALVKEANGFTPAPPDEARRMGVALSFDPRGRDGMEPLVGLGPTPGVSVPDWWRASIAGLLG